MPCCGGIGGLANILLRQPVAFVYKHLAYPFKTRTNVSELSTTANALVARGEDIRNQIANAGRNGEQPTQVAEDWLRRVDSLRAANDNISTQYAQRCNFFGCCFPNCLSNYKISKKAAERLREANRLESPPTNLTADPGPRPVLEIPVAELLPSQTYFLAYALQLINEPGGMIGLWGTEGIGKTNILKKINNSFIGKTTFDFVIFLTASRECSVLRIQTEIMNRLRLNRDDDVVSQATRIMSFLADKSFLLLVDDLWEKLDLAAVGIPIHLGTQGQSNQKVVITTRSQNVCDLMHATKSVEVPCLVEDEARKLFEENVGLENLYSHAHIGPLAEELLKELKGIPAKLIGVGKSMCRKEDPKQWKDTILKVKGLVLHDVDGQLSMAGRNLKDLEEKKEYLRQKSNDVRYQIEILGRNGKIARNEVSQWLWKADVIISRIIALSAQYSLNNSDVIMRIPEMLREVETCLKDQPSNIDHEAVPPTVQLHEVPGPSLFTREVNLLEARRLIKEVQVGRIAIWGQGGVGKTHLLKTINNSFFADSFFDVVIFVTASRESSVSQIQAEIVKNQKLKKDEDTLSQAHIISTFLETKNFLLLLDGLWDKIDLQAVGIPHPLGHGIGGQFKRTVVLTTRLQDVCNSMEVNETIKVCCLEKVEAWQLFMERVGLETISCHPDITASAKDIVNEINGLPLGLVEIGSALRGQKSSGYWDSVSKHMQQSCRDENCPKSVLGVFEKLMYSYDKLRNQTLRDCFRTCSLWPEGCQIMKDDLAHCWLGLGLVDELGKASGIIGELEAASLLEGDVLGISVKMHDLFHDMALQISGDKWVVHTGYANSGELEDAGFFQDTLSVYYPHLLRGPIPLNGALARNFPWRNAEYVSLMLNCMKDLPRVSMDDCLKNLKTLCLQHNLLNERTVGIIEKFTMLTYLDLSSNRLKKIPEELCVLAMLEYLNLSYNHAICEVPDSFRKLVKLKFLFLGRTSIRTVPQGVISSLKKLQVLDTWSSYKPGMSCAVNWVLSICPELDSLNDLKEVDIVLGGVSEYEALSERLNLPLRKVTLQDMNSEYASFCLSGGMFEDNLLGESLFHLEIVQSNMVHISIEKDVETPAYPFKALEVLKLKCLESLKVIMWRQMRPQDTFPKLSFLEVTFCDELEHISCAMYLPCLRVLHLSYCSSIREAFWINKNMPTTPTFPSLEFLYFACLEGLVSICSSDVTFPSLKSLTCKGCERLERLPFKMETLPPNLQVVFDDRQHWEKLKWEEGVKSSLKVTIEEPYGEVDVTRSIQFLVPFFPANTGYLGGRCPCDMAMLEQKYAADATFSMESSFSMGSFSMGSSSQPSTSTRTSSHRSTAARTRRGTQSSTH